MITLLIIVTMEHLETQEQKSVCPKQRWGLCHELLYQVRVILLQHQLVYICLFSGAHAKKLLQKRPAKRQQHEQAIWVKDEARACRGEKSVSTSSCHGKVYVEKLVSLVESIHPSDALFHFLVIFMGLLKSWHNHPHQLTRKVDVFSSQVESIILLFLNQCKLVICIVKA